jgi:hypothetical protein
MCHSIRTLAILSLIGLVLASACAAATSQGAPEPTPVDAAATSFLDPYAYCAAVGTIDTPDEQYAGPDMPESVVQGLIEQGIVSDDAPPAFQNNAVWRCMDGQVWACHFGANLPCEEKANTSRTPSQEMEAFCEENPAADTMPAAVTGRATVYEWTCAEGKPEAGRQLFQADPQGFLADFWTALPSR